MNEDAFFAVEPIHPDWQNIFSFENIFYTFIASIIIFGIFLFLEKFLKSILKNPQKHKEKALKNEVKKIEYIFPEISDKNFEEKIFYLMQQFATNTYLPKNAFAHSSYDIAKYCNNEIFLQYYKNLEEKIFQKKFLSQEEKNQILSFLKNLIAKNSK